MVTIIKGEKRDRAGKLHHLGAAPAAAKLDERLQRKAVECAADTRPKVCQGITTILLTSEGEGWGGARCMVGLVAGEVGGVVAGVAWEALVRAWVAGMGAWGVAHQVGEEGEVAVLVAGAEEAVVGALAV